MLELPTEVWSSLRQQTESFVSVGRDVNKMSNWNEDVGLHV